MRGFGLRPPVSSGGRRASVRAMERARKEEARREKRRDEERRVGVRLTGWRESERGCVLGETQCVRKERENNLAAVVCDIEERR